MAKRLLSDKKKKEIIADYAIEQNARAVARMHQVSDATVRALVKNNADIARICAQKKEENTRDVLAHMESKKNEVCYLIDEYLKWMMDKKKLEKASVNQLSTALGTVIDKFTMDKTDNTVVVEHYIPAEGEHEADHD